MSKQFKILIIVVVVLGIAVGLAALGLVLDPYVTIRDWWTGNEAHPMGQWDAGIVYESAEGATIDRNATHYEGSYSYRHYAECTVGECWAASQKACTPAVTQGLVDFMVYFGELPDPDESEAYMYPILAVGDVTDFGEPPDMDFGLSIEYWPQEDSLYVVCDNCNPAQQWSIGTPMVQRWYNIVMEWDLPEATYNDGVLRVWKDGNLKVDFSTLYSDQPGDYYDHNDVVVGIVDWPLSDGGGTAKAVFVDDVTIYGCSEVYPTPTPVVGDTCATWGNNSVINVASDCSGVMRFEGLGIPITATINYIGLKVYGIGVEEPGETVTVTPLNALWGEETCNWCNRLMWTEWDAGGATMIPEDRSADDVGTFKTQLGWQQIELDKTVIGLTWLLDTANAGVILHNSSMTGKWSIASGQWYDPVEDYSPQLIVNWE